MVESSSFESRVVEHLAELLDIPSSHYQKARDRYESLGEWLHRPASQVLCFDPQVYPQGSFRYGTVIRPLSGGEEYDLDLVCQLAIEKDHISQAALKALVGGEIQAYATAHRMNEPAHEGNRCWRLDYADDVSFHMDILPAVPEDDSIKMDLQHIGIPWHLAQHAIAITDRRHRGFQQVQPDWPPSNPKGFAAWFQDRMKAVARARLELLVEARLYASVDDVPTFEWKTPLQRSIQILKRHRDVMFQKTPELRPISMIITTLSAQAYQGESNLFQALSSVLDRMPQFVRETRPKVANPVHPGEDFAEKWAKDPRLEKNFWEWHTQARADLDRIVAAPSASRLVGAMRAAFTVVPDDEFIQRISGAVGPPTGAVVKAAPVLITKGPRPWGACA